LVLCMGRLQSRPSILFLRSSSIINHEVVGSWHEEPSILF